MEEEFNRARRIKANIERGHQMRDYALDPESADRLSFSSLDGMVLEDGVILNQW